MNTELREIKDLDLMNHVKTLRGTECKLIADMVLHLSEIERRGIYRDAGYSSLFTFLRESLGYSEGSALRRVRAVRCLTTTPEIYELLRDGKVSLSSLAEVTPVMTQENKTEVLKLTIGTSKREAQRIAVSFGAQVMPKNEIIRAVKVLAKKGTEAESYSFTFQVGPEVKALYEEARALMGHLSAGEVFEKALKSFVNKKKGVGIRTRALKSSSPDKKRSRAIPVSVKREVFKRDNCQCTYETQGKRCTEKVGLQIDHIKPFALGGSHELENLRLRCSAHNILAAEEYFGKGFMGNFTGNTR